MVSGQWAAGRAGETIGPGSAAQCSGSLDPGDGKHIHSSLNGVEDVVRS